MAHSKKRPKSQKRPALVAPVSAAPGEKTVDQLIRELKNGENEIIRSTAAGWLGYVKSEKGVAPLIQALKDSHPWVRHGAAWALGEMRSEKAVDALRQALNDDDDLTRMKAAEALEKIRQSVTA